MRSNVLAIVGVIVWYGLLHGWVYWTLRREPIRLAHLTRHADNENPCQIIPGLSCSEASGQGIPKTGTGPLSYAPAALAGTSPTRRP